MPIFLYFFIPNCFSLIQNTALSRLLIQPAEGLCCKCTTNRFFLCKCYLCTFSTSLHIMRKIFAHELVCSSHPASFRFHLTMDTLAFGYILPTTGRIRDFNPLETCAARRTYTRIPAMPNNFALREFYYNLLLNSTAPAP